LGLKQNSLQTRENQPSAKTAQTQILNQYLARPIIYIKVIRARDLVKKDGSTDVNPYTQITLGSSTAKTTVCQATVNPEWGMVFAFDFDYRDRYAKIDVWDADTNHFLGMIARTDMISYTALYNSIELA
jgi:hypothetical protein